MSAFLLVGSCIVRFVKILRVPVGYNLLSGLGGFFSRQLVRLLKYCGVSIMRSISFSIS